jgi:hypothetical protein
VAELLIDLEEVKAASAERITAEEACPRPWGRSSAALAIVRNNFLSALCSVQNQLRECLNSDIRASSESFLFLALHTVAIQAVNRSTLCSLSESLVAKLHLFEPGSESTRTF